MNFVTLTKCYFQQQRQAMLKMFCYLLQLFPQCEEWMVRPLTEARDKYEMMKEEQEVKKKEVNSEICLCISFQETPSQ